MKVGVLDRMAQMKTTYVVGFLREIDRASISLTMHCIVHFFCFGLVQIVDHFQLYVHRSQYALEVVSGLVFCISSRFPCLAS